MPVGHILSLVEIYPLVLGRVALFLPKEAGHVFFSPKFFSGNVVLVLSFLPQVYVVSTKCTQPQQATIVTDGGKSLQ